MFKEPGRKCFLVLKAGNLISMGVLKSIIKVRVRQRAKQMQLCCEIPYGKCKSVALDTILFIDCDSYYLVFLYLGYFLKNLL